MDEESKVISEDSEPLAPLSESGEPAAVARNIAYCSTCQTNVEPLGKGRCPKCGQFTTFNSFPRKNPANIKRREQYHRENLAEYQPDSLLLRDACRLLANVREKLDTIREGTPEHQRLIAAWTELTATLEASRSTRATTVIPDITPADAIERAERVIQMARLLVAAEPSTSGRADSPAPGLPVGSEPPDASKIALGRPEADDLDPAGIRGRPESSPVLEATCQYCHQTPCVGRSHHAYDVLHALDPEHVEARAKKATAEMYESFRRERKGDPWVR